MLIRIHYRQYRPGPWASIERDVAQVPHIGEYVALAANQVYRVSLTLHIAYDAKYVAEVFAESVNFHEVQSKSIGQPVWPG